MPPLVVIHTTPNNGRRVRIDKINNVLCNRVKEGEEQYLVKWKTPTKTPHPPLSWHNLNELAQALEFVQDYLDRKHRILRASRKRKSPDTEDEPQRRLSPAERTLISSSRTPSTERSGSVSSSLSLDRYRYASPNRPYDLVEIYNGEFDWEEGFLYAKPTSAPGAFHINVTTVPTQEMADAARKASTQNAEVMIRAEFMRRLRLMKGPQIKLVNIYDNATPSLRFRFIEDYILRDGVYKADPATQTGCQQCKPRMGRDIGCEYTKKCDCLEYAAVDEKRLSPEQRAKYDEVKLNGGSIMEFPKRFPYFAHGAKVEREGCLVGFYLESRHPIYECNDNCNCGPACRNKNVQYGRRVELTIFKTGSGRGWGLRCGQDLHEGQFIDTYRGEIITDAEATRRERNASKSKASYLYSLDKFAEAEGFEDEDIYVVDGEFMGGPTKFINHSCEPNCRQYTVSYNKHDPRVYDIAFFASRFIPKGEELTFDYLDKDEEEEEDENKEVQQPGEGAVPCLCGAPRCRKWLWT